MLGDLRVTCAGCTSNISYLFDNLTCSMHCLRGPCVSQCMLCSTNLKHYTQLVLLQAKGREAIRSSSVVPALLRLLRGGQQRAQAGAAAALANLSCEPQSVRLIRRSDGIPPLVQLLGFVSMGASEVVLVYMHP